MIVSQGIISKSFTGLGSFALGDNVSMACGGSGVCNLSLKEKVFIHQVPSSSKCVSRTCELMRLV
jgi:hypothetical protein